MIEITKLSEFNYTAQTIEEIKNIFFLSSSLKEFSSEERKAAFFKRWCGDYLTHFPEFFYLMHEEGKLLGYLSGCTDSLQAAKILSVPGYEVFADLFVRYPAHLHINFHPDCRGKGLGSKLIENYLTELKNLRLSGVHLVTSPEAANISFYQRLGFSDVYARDLNAIKLLFMGKKLD
jgi:ribosomal protein S18 acetylase RimI-like enzyme